MWVGGLVWAGRLVCYRSALCLLFSGAFGPSETPEFSMWSRAVLVSALGIEWCLRHLFGHQLRALFKELLFLICSMTGMLWLAECFFLSRAFQLYPCFVSFCQTSSPSFVTHFPINLIHLLPLSKYKVKMWCASFPKIRRPAKISSSTNHKPQVRDGKKMKQKSETICVKAK